MKKTIKNILPFVLTAIGSLLSFAVTIVLSRTLGSQDYGHIQYWIGIITTFSAFSGFGIPNLLIRDQHLYDDKKKFFTSCLLLLLVFNLIALPIFFLISYFAFNELNKDVLLIFTIIGSSIASSIVLILQYHYMGIGKKNRSTIIGSVIFKLLLLITSTIFLVLNLNNFVHSYFVYIYFAVYLIVILPPIFINCKKEYFRFNKAQLLSALIFMVISFCSGSTAQVGKILIGETGNGDFTPVALYSISIQILTVVSSFIGVFTAIARPKFSEFYTNNDFESIEKLYRSILRLTCRIALPIYIGIIIQQNSVFSIFGEGYSGFPWVFIILAIAFIYTDLCGPAGTILAMAHQEKRELIVNLIQFAIFCLVGFLTIKYLYFAVPLAILSSYIVSATIRVIMIKKKFNFLAFDLNSMLQLAIEAVVSFGIFFAINFIDNITFKLILDFVCGAVVILCFYFAPVFNKDTSYFFRKY